ncbi:SUF system Fe-S cluster assembly regulator [Parasaccharibacter sp. TMW2.1882]|uniref:Iron-sulfur cluster regulator IscR n=2 Tax=Acetobacteraceae TaxID=433 RepID=A0A7U7G5Q1_9PROT|nr:MULTISPECIES: SUF system Fe-S cluster assembly regulator [Acetobacteraceae]MCK8636886.1 SUF system Fe-S cluster assembly regulator [Parasaccharibacter sp. TMW2.1885]MCL1496002.1 SUF system Fe-S cluster assembly regulator [Parasaccharibacter sp. TMW2.1882]MCL1511490.1 SUF system Fe-S cluster assembly regulator [Parasaccharibacter sp. TMW 2.1884]MCL1513543.1 SUF system Fe-S cluster assembly regulator [Parasaccharibacter sp. TMW 2.1891]MCL1562852.1 SUF system Fe-S cluster assembly regulator [P
MLRLSKLADYATVVLVRLGVRGDLATAASLAQETGVPEPTVAKLLKGLAAGGLVVSFRGARGGYRLAEELADISVARVISVVDGPICVTACCDGKECAHGETCGLSGQWDMVNAAVRQALETITLADMANPDLKFDPSSATSVEATMHRPEEQGECHAGCVRNP